MQLSHKTARAPSGCADECRRLADAAYDLAQSATRPEVMREILNMAGKLVTCADRADRGEPDPWSIEGAR